ncbi:MAG TPA: NAD(P)-dependent oxidoreductase [Patescibacteria group bacterium]|nr:NAD(P)-dependent oxidoreductase [Patescibacteria group bacterium]
MKILGTGLNGLIGSRIVELLASSYTFENISRTEGVDITNFEQLVKAMEESDAEIVLHLAAYTNVKQAELDRELQEESDSWKINVLGSKNVVKACESTGKKLIFASTDMVFDGEDTPEGGYRETDSPNPLSWYAITKYEAEKIVQSSSIPWSIMRIAYPYRANFGKNDFVRLFLQKISNHEELTVLTDRIISPVFIDDLAGAVDALITHQAEGIYHTVGSSIVSIYEAANEIADVFALDKNFIKGTTRAEFLVGRPPEPFNSALNNAKIKSLGVSMRTFREGLSEVKKQLNS